MSLFLSLPSSCASCASLIPWCPLRPLWWRPSPFSDLPSNPIFSKRNTGKGPISKGCLGCGISEMRRVKLLKKGFVEFWRQLEHQLHMSLFILGTHPNLYWYFSVTGCLCYSCVSWSLYSLAPTLKKPFIFLINNLTDLLLYLPGNFIPDVFAF